MRKLMVAGNWKMHGSTTMIRQLMDGIEAGLETSCLAEVVVFPPFPYLPLVSELAAGGRVAWGAQNLNPNPQGAHTGEVSADMLVEFGCRYVLVGHSERRALYAETSTGVAEKFRAALEAGLQPVLCVGETLEQREAGETEAVVARQLDAVLAAVGIEGFSEAVVAYEPVWAIGTGHTATPEQAQAVHAYIRHKFAALDGTIAGQLRILYGGSVKGSNAADLFAREDIDGGLVGGASLTAEGFLDICRCGS
ncbi:MAG: triose-phosphate isomerase [Xanthomonadales bacterium]|nr:triose-phosphate isomerase [Xanthomonadales bacterium]NIN59405.1 triose-phosphate isomerase [Xanthomonadales bacterium]NIN74756.1 triose-phosphate isomerase [Xanthomonadales bacterium]NIO14892.1 triose-phosphate isomerase [Xanthomonadales bacterium]NIP11798.1 triose-phosphate isomerase [Xanthomonadales bacterium]